MKCYLYGDININYQPKDKEMFRNKSTNSINKEIPDPTWKYLGFVSHIP